MVTMLQVYKTTRHLVVVPIVVYLIIYSKRLQWGGNCYGISEQVACMGTWIGVIIGIYWYILLYITRYTTSGMTTKYLVVL